jgi:hypothetical protein
VLLSAAQTGQGEDGMSATARMTIDCAEASVSSATAINAR